MNNIEPPELPIPSRFEVSPQQADTASLLSRLFGKSFSDRYIDFCRLSAGTFPLTVSTPLAGHSLRELESILRQMLAVPMEAVVSEFADPDKIKAAKAQLLALGFDQDAVQRALDGLQPRFSHKDQIRAIVGRLGLAPDGDVAKAWISISDAHRKAHERPFHRSLTVDDGFRAEWQEPFDMVIRGVAVALQSKYAALMLRAEEIARMADVVNAVKLYEKEIPNALPLQWHFFETLESPAWLPHLIKREIFLEPISGFEDSPTAIRFREWPIGHYLERMAKSTDDQASSLVAQALQSLKDAKHSDVRSKGFDILVALPASEAAKLADVATSWLNQEAALISLSSANQLVISLASNGEIEAALTIARSLLQIRSDNGRLRTLYGHLMYEYFLPDIADALTRAAGERALALLVDLLEKAAAASGKIQLDPPADYTSLLSQPVTDDGMATSDVFNGLVSAVRKSAEALVSTAEAAPAIDHLAKCNLAIVRRVELHVLAMNPAAAPERATALLENVDLLENAQAAQEYGELAVAWFPSLPIPQQQAILISVDTIADRHIDAWQARFQEYHGRPFNGNDEQVFREVAVRDATWRWRSVLPTDRRNALDAIVARTGEPDAWKNRILWRSGEESPVTAQEIAERTEGEIIDLLHQWRPSEEPARQTVTALAGELRRAVADNPEKFSKMADRFGALRPIYVRSLFEGLQSAVGAPGKLDWNRVLNLVETTFDRLGESLPASATGDDVTWVWATKAAVDVLNAGLGAAPAMLEIIQADVIQRLIQTLSEKAPHEPELEDFEERFTRNPFFAGEATLRGAVIELCVHYLIWLNGLGAPIVVAEPRQAIVNHAWIGDIFDAALADASVASRGVRAILGRYLNWLHYLDPNWIASRVEKLFPVADPTLRNAAWLGHLHNDGGPNPALFSGMESCYLGEIDRINEPAEDYHSERLAIYILNLYLNNAFPSHLMQKFWDNAPPKILRQNIWHLGNYLGSPNDKVPAPIRQRCIDYWDERLASGTQASDTKRFGEELGTVGNWCIHSLIDPDWLIAQLLLLLKAGYVPASGYSVIEWLATNSTGRADIAVEVLDLFVRSPGVEQWEFKAQPDMMRQILDNGRATGNAQTDDRIKGIASYLSSIGETSLLDYA